MSLHFLNTFGGQIITGLVIVICSGIIWFILKKIQKPCIKCGKNRTFPNRKGIVICEDCRNDERLVKANQQEKQLLCPFDGTAMNKKIIKETRCVVDVCPSCKRILLQKEHLEKLVFNSLDLYPK